MFYCTLNASLIHTLSNVHLQKSPISTSELNELAYKNQSLEIAAEKIISFITEKVFIVATRRSPQDD